MTQEQKKHLLRPFKEIRTRHKTGSRCCNPPQNKQAAGDCFQLQQPLFPLTEYILCHCVVGSGEAKFASGWCVIDSGRCLERMQT